ncbi:hypothetical protein BC829DRAFT_394639 [Chytridium lagenaria]|nr:hypothetical protein BC829DRAFT_394639 [Chytridium lagenaria]
MEDEEQHGYGHDGEEEDGDERDEGLGGKEGREDYYESGYGGGEEGEESPDGEDGNTDNDASNSMQVIDFLDSYLQACSFKQLPVVPHLQAKLQEAIDGGALPKIFDLNGNHPNIRNIRLTDDYAELLTAPLSAINFLQELDLSFNEIGDRGARAIAGFLKDDKYLKVLKLNSNSIKAEGGMAIAKALNINETLTFIDVGDNEIGDVGGMEFAAMLQAPLSAATSLIALFTVLQNNTTITHLDLSNNESHHSRSSQSLQNDLIMHLARMLKMNRGIKVMGLRKFGVTDWSMTDCLAMAVKVNMGVKELDLSCNRITRDGGVSLCQALYKHSYISRLNLSCCSIQDQGAEAVSLMLLYNKCLSRLFLDHNNISGKGIRALAHAITKNHTITHLTLWGNVWDVEACEAFSTLVGGPFRVVKMAGDAEKHGRQSQRKRKTTFTRLQPQNVDVVFYSVEGVLHVARNTQFIP